MLDHIKRARMTEPTLLSSSLPHDAVWNIKAPIMTPSARNHPRKTNARVKFDLQRNEVYHHKVDPSRFAEARLLWLSDSEVDSIRYSAAMQVKKYISGQTTEGADRDEDCIRGLEFQADPVIYRRKTQGGRRFVATILEQQKFQRKIGSMEYADLLARISKDMSKPDVQEALLYGAKDAWQSASPRLEATCAAVIAITKRNKVVQQRKRPRAPVA